MIPAALLPLIGVVADAIYLTITKAFLRRFEKFNSREFNWFMFATVVVILAVLMPFIGELPVWPEIVRTAPWLLGAVILACLHNSLFYWGLKHEKISEIEPFLLFSPLAGILIAGIFYPSERFVQVYIAIVIASIILLWSHYRRHQVALSDGLLAILAFIILSGLELVFLKRLLEVWNPLTLYFVRCIFVLIGLTLAVRPRLSVVKPHHLKWFGAIGVLIVIAVWATYSAFKLRGLSETLFVFTLSPILVYWFSAMFLKEKLQIKNIIASTIIIGLVVWITLLK
jgi:drug/metabolite transporter (DMT)-like permease